MLCICADVYIVQVHKKAVCTASVLASHGKEVEVVSEHYFDTLQLRVPDAQSKVAGLAKRFVIYD